MGGTVASRHHNEMLLGLQYYICAVYSKQVSWWRYPKEALLTQGSISLVDGYQVKVSGHSHQLLVTNTTLTSTGSYVCQVALGDLKLYRKNFTLYGEGMLMVHFI